MAENEKSSEGSGAKLSGFGPAILRLHALGMPAKRLAELFETTPGNVHVLCHRERQRAQRVRSPQKSTSLAEVTSLSTDELRKAKERLGLRAEQDRVELTPKKLRTLEWLETRMEEIAGVGRSSYRFLDAATSLRALKQYFGYPSESKLLKILAKLHQHLAWFYTHSGYASSCIAEATHSIRLYEMVYRDTEDKDALRELGGSCLIRSNSRLTQGSGQVALNTLQLSEQATLAADKALNSEYYRQRGVALLQIRQDQAAKKMFECARAPTPDSDVKNGSMTLKMSSERHLNLIATPFPRMDQELELLGEAHQVYGADSLEAVMCTHWAAACGLCTDSKTAHLLSRDLIEQNQSKISRFGHQATISKLLPIALELPPNKRPLFVRFALYQNAFRSR